MLDLLIDFAAILERLFRLVQLTQDYLQQRGWIVCNLLLTEGPQVQLERFRQTDPVEGAVIVFAHRNLDLLRGVFHVSHDEVAVVFDDNLVVLELVDAAVDENQVSASRLYVSCPIGTFLAARLGFVCVLLSLTLAIALFTVGIDALLQLLLHTFFLLFFALYDGPDGLPADDLLTVGVEGHPCDLLQPSA